MRIVRYENVMHIVSGSTTRKRAIRTPLSGAGSIFPVGTFSGTPKIRAIKIIAELESYRLNAYGGGIGFFI